MCTCLETKSPSACKVDWLRFHMPGRFHSVELFVLMALPENNITSLSTATDNQDKQPKKK